MTVSEKLIKIADASRRVDGSDTPLGEQLREAAARIAALEAENDALRGTLSSIALDCQGASVCGEPEIGLETIYHKATDGLAAREVAK